MPTEIVTSADLRNYDKMTFVGQTDTQYETYEATRQPKAAWDILITQSNTNSQQIKITNSKGLLNFINLRMKRWFLSGTLKLESNNSRVNPLEFKF